MAQKVRGSSLKQVPLSELKNDLSRFLREAAKGTRLEDLDVNEP